MSPDESRQFHKKVIDNDLNVFVISTNSISQDSLERFTSPADLLAKAYQNYEEFVGSSYYKHQRLYKYYQQLVQSLKDPAVLIYPPMQLAHNQSINESHASSKHTQDDRTSVFLKENVQILPKLLRKVLQAIKEFNFAYSVITPPSQLMANMVTQNNVSRKVGILALKKLCVFDQVIFGRPDDQIKTMFFSSYPRNWKAVVYFRRTLQVYD